MHKVYRYEGQNDGRGPYNSTWLHMKAENVSYILGETHVGDIKRPSPRRDELSKYIYFRESKFACDTLNALKNWFYGFNEKLISEGFILIEYTVKEKFSGMSGLQCLFFEDDIIEKKVVEGKCCPLFSGNFPLLSHNQ